MGDAAAHNHRMGFARELDVIGVAACAAHQYRIFGTRHRLTDAEFHQGKAMGIVLQIHELISGFVMRVPGLDPGIDPRIHRKKSFIR